MKNKIPLWVLVSVAIVLSIVTTLVFHNVSEETARDILPSYLGIWFFWSQVIFGSYLLLLILLVTGSQLGLRLRARFLHISMLIPVLGLTFLPLLTRSPILYSRVFLTDNQAQLFYFSPGVLWIRTALMFSVWTASVVWLRRTAVKSVDSEKVSKSLRVSAAFCLGIHVLLSSLGSVDWVMALEPKWRSSSLGFIILSLQILSGIAIAILVSFHPRQIYKRGESVVFSSMGGLLQAAVIFFVYLAFCQYLLAWYGNLPERGIWYIRREGPVWQTMGWIIFLSQIVIPFFTLLSKRSRQSVNALRILASTTLVNGLLASLWMTVPSLRINAPALRMSDLGVLLPYSALWMGLMLTITHITPPPTTKGVGA
ncbi:MAG: hypothetical protein H7249_02270 [Chitinophagaceae bacterium]|nr:hypothetical protein [Oligoflexus sp.]